MPHRGPAVLTSPAVAHPDARPSRGLTEALPHRGAERVPQEEFHLGRTTRQWPRHPVSRRGLSCPGCAPYLTDTRSHPTLRNAERPAPDTAPCRVPIGHHLPSLPPIGPHAFLSEAPLTPRRPIGRRSELGHRNFRPAQRHRPWPAPERESESFDSFTYSSI